MKIKFLVVFLVLSICSVFAYAQDTVYYSDPSRSVIIGDKVSILEDKTNTLSVSDAISSNDYVNKKQQVPNLEVSNSAFWVKIIITNLTAQSNLCLKLEYPTIDSVTFIEARSATDYYKVVSGEFVPFNKREFKHQSYIFRLSIAQAQTKVFYIKVIASEQIQLPLMLGTTQSVENITNVNDIIFGLYAGIILVMFLYNLFIYFTVRDRTYLYYVFYILFVGLVQACLEGYAPRFFYPDSYFLANAMMVWMPALSGISGILFTQNFLSVKNYAPRLNKVLIGIILLYVVIIVVSFTGNYRLCAKMLLGTVGILAILVYSTALIIAFKGYRPAKFFTIAWTIFIISVVMFVLRNFNVLPYNIFTHYALQIGSACEIVLLSFALADKINTYRKEKEESQEQAMEALQENERIVREQNVILERKVDERTYELKLSNEELNKALVDLKEAEGQLVESEKMASLGQLTAGIAHEINNPINFVTSNVKPLNRDVKMLFDAVLDIEKIVTEDGSAAEKKKKIDEYKNEIDFDYLKDEIDQLLSGIGEGASRTAEIVKGLRIFSRLDEDDLKKADINEGLESTLVITNNLLNNTIKVEKKYASMPMIECYAGKLNQVFLNMISNAIYAIRKKFGDQEGGKLTITTEYDMEHVYVKIGDNGTGMDENTKKRLFEPFFTTKDVGEGTGLGLSISYNTINKHNGQILVNSEVGVGTEFIIILPLVQK